MEIEFRELSRMRVWIITADGEFVGILVLDTQDVYRPFYNIFFWSADTPGRFVWIDAIYAFGKPEKSATLEMRIRAELE